MEELQRMKRVRKTEKDEERDRGNTTNLQILLNFVSIWQPSGILMTGQSRWISRFESSSLPMTTLFSSKVRILISTSTQPKVTWGFLCNSDTNLEELNIGHCVDNMQNIRPQKNFHKLSLPRRIFEGGGSDSKIQVVVLRFPNTEEFELM